MVAGGCRFCNSLEFTFLIWCSSKTKKEYGKWWFCDDGKQEYENHTTSNVDQSLLNKLKNSDLTQG